VGARVVFINDEEPIRHDVADILVGAGYQVSRFPKKDPTLAKDVPLRVLASGEVRMSLRPVRLGLSCKWLPEPGFHTLSYTARVVRATGTVQTPTWAPSRAHLRYLTR
jgi:hypothetical protein